MTGPDGPLRADALAHILSGIEITPPRWPASVYLYQALQHWNRTQEACGQPIIAGPALLAEFLEVTLLQEGWCLSDWHDGHVLVFAASDFEAAVQGFFASARQETGPHTQAEDRQKW